VRQPNNLPPSDPQADRHISDGLDIPKFLLRSSGDQAHEIPPEGIPAPTAVTVVVVNPLAEHAAEIRRLHKRVIADVIEIGRRLTECKKIVGHGAWLPWLTREFSWSDRTARNFMQLFELSKLETVSNLKVPLRVLYLLAAPSTPPEARTEILECAKSRREGHH
jgi:hypothetical protein